MVKSVSHFLRRQLMQEVADEYAACLDCVTTACPEERWQTCRRRLNAEQAMKDYRRQTHNDILPGQDNLQPPGVS